MSRVCCVTGAAGYIGSWLVKKLLDRGCVVHATLRNLEDEKKTALLRALPGAAERLVLFQADMHDAATFEPAIAGCEFVFLVAAPMMQDISAGKSKDSIEGAVTAMRAILEQCERSKTVKRVIHTGSVVAASPLKEDGHGFKPFVDESCWTPLNLSYGYSNEILNAYVSSKTLSENELLRYNEDSPSKASLEVVTLLCGLVAGDTVLPDAPGSIRSVVSPLTGDEVWHGGLKFMQALLGAVPVVHVDDACEAHVFFMECPAPVAGRFLCAAGHPNMRDIVDHYGRKFPELKLRIEEVVGEGVRVQPGTGTSKLMDMGFKYRYGVEEVLDGSAECSKRLGLL